MKSETPHSLALYVAAMISSISAVLVSVLIWIIQEKFLWEITTGTFALNFIVTYILFRYTVNKFIYQKIKLVYKTIHQLKLGQKKILKKKIETGDDIIADVNNEVIAWASDKKQEIDELKKMEEYRREFIGNLAHELKTPVFNIQGYISTLMEEENADHDMIIKYLENADKNVDRMINLIQDLDTVSRLESGQMTLENEKFNVVALAKEVLELLEMRAQEKNIKLILKENYDDIWVMGDVNSIKQVFTNLVVNSIAYGNQNGTTKISFYDMDAHILIEVTDDGPGIAETHLPRLFERFYRVDKSRSRHMGGTGLGLSIVKHIIEAHRQTINVRSTLGKGSTFSFTLKKYKA